MHIRVKTMTCKNNPPPSLQFLTAMCDLLPLANRHLVVPIETMR